jgi:hypothetical protein
MQLIHDERADVGGSRRTTGEAAVTAAGDARNMAGGSAANIKQQADASPRKVVLLHG